MRTGIIGAVALAALMATPAVARETRAKAPAGSAQVTRTAAPKAVTTTSAPTKAKSTAAKPTRARATKAPTIPIIVPAAAGGNGAGSMVTCADTSFASNCLAFGGNLNGGSSEAELDAAIEQLLGTSFDFDFQAVEGTKSFFSFDGDDPTGLLTFGQTLFGDQVLSVKVKNNTLLFAFDFGTTGANSVQLGVQGLSNALLITPPGGGGGGTDSGGGVGAVPEPSTWAMMLLGFGGMGAALRRRRRRSTIMQQMA